MPMWFAQPRLQGKHLAPCRRPTAMRLIAQILSGVEQRETVIIHLSEAVENGRRVEQR